jgi:hypothetical protein
MSWTELARDAVSNNKELREEFSGIAYDSLGPIQQQQVNRIRQGVRAMQSASASRFLPNLRLTSLLSKGSRKTPRYSPM